jgi:phenylalanyl-tRNA synthetase beta chain
MTRGGEHKSGVLAGRVKDFLAGAGLSEVINYSFFNRAQLDKLYLAAEDARLKAIPLANPITDDFTFLRTSLVPGLLNTLSYNIAHSNEDVSLFELGAVYLPDDLPLRALPREETVLGAVLTGRLYPEGWNQPKETAGFYYVKGLAEELFSLLNIRDYELTGAAEPYLHPGKSARLIYRGRAVGCLGEVHPRTAAAFDLAGAVLLELYLTPLTEDACRLSQYEKLPKYPETYRDLSLLVPAGLPHQTVDRAIKEQGGELLSSWRLFDVYTGKQVEEGYKGMSYALAFQSAERTLTDEEVGVLLEGIVSRLAKELKVKLRTV